MSAFTKPSATTGLVLSGQAAFALEAKLLEQVSSGQSSFEIAIWQTERCLVVPQAFTRNALFNQAAESSRNSGWPVFVRCTGGDVTPQGPGILNVTLVYRVSANRTPSIDQHYRLLCQPIFEHLRVNGHTPEFSAIDHSFCDGAHNLSVNGRKMVGAAQRWRSIRDGSGLKMVFAHALVLVDADLESGIISTNALYQGCNISHRIKEEVHVNLSSLVPTIDKEKFDVSDYAAHLLGSYKQIFETPN